ncbi:hypothetical protein Efla_004077 [Eimeria flavescens]
MGSAAAAPPACLLPSPARRWVGWGVRCLRVCLRAAAVVAASAASAAGGDGVVVQPLPSLNTMPPMDLSHEGLEALLAEMQSAAVGRPSQVQQQPVSSLLTLLSELLRSAEGTLLPPREKKEAGRLTESLRNVLAQQSILRQKLGALQTVATENQRGPINTEAIRQVAQRLLDQYRQLEEIGRQILQSLTDLLRALLPDLSRTLPSISPAEPPATENVMRSLREMFPEILD